VQYPKSIQLLIDELVKLPGVGPKTAERYIFYLLKQNNEKLHFFGETIAGLKKDLKICHYCLSVSNSDPCPICSDQSREQSSLCVVENSRDLATIEGTKQFSGRYFVLGGLINTLDDVGPDSLPFKKLEKLVEEKKINEVIAALSFTIEGETTAMYIARLLKGKAKISRLARGLPSGSNLEYADDLTLLNALKYRNEI
jgi:recombination protein RecR